MEFFVEALRNSIDFKIKIHTQVFMSEAYRLATNFEATKLGRLG